MSNINENSMICADKPIFDIENTIPHCAVILVLDTSHSMWGKGLTDLKNSLLTFYKTLQNEEFLYSEIDIAAVSMGDNLGMIEEFTPFHSSILPQINIRPKGDTPIGAALELACRKIAEQLNHYNDKGIAHVTPQLIILSDGKKSSDDFSGIAAYIRNACTSNTLICRAIAMGASPDCNALSEIAGDNVIKPSHGDLRDAFAKVGRQVSETFEAKVEELIHTRMDKADSSETYEAEAEELIVNQSSDCVPTPSVASIEECETEFLLDGSNIMHWDKERYGISLRNVLSITKELELQGKPYQVYFDATARHILEKACPQEAVEYDDIIKKQPEKYHQVPAGTTADSFLLFLANEKPNRLIMTNDRFNDHVSKYPWVKNSNRLLPGMILGKTIYFPKIDLQFPVIEADK